MSFNTAVARGLDPSGLLKGDAATIVGQLARFSEVDRFYLYTLLDAMRCITVQGYLQAPMRAEMFAGSLLTNTAAAK
jgi:hypothetical protein